MSTENARAFVEKVKEDPELQEKLQNLPQDDVDAALARVLEIAQQEGYVFSAENWQEVAIASDPQLNDQELEQVAGGQAVACVYRNTKLL